MQHGKKIQIIDFTVTPEDREKVGFKGTENEILVIPETFVDPDDGKLYRVVKIDEYAFQDCVLTSINIPEGVTSIGEDVFYSCTSLASIGIDRPINSITGAPWGAPIVANAVKWLR